MLQGHFFHIYMVKNIYIKDLYKLYLKDYIMCIYTWKIVSYIHIYEKLKTFSLILKSEFWPEKQSASSLLSNLDVLFFLSLLCFINCRTLHKVFPQGHACFQVLCCIVSYVSVTGPRWQVGEAEELGLLPARVLLFHWCCLYWTA